MKKRLSPYLLYMKCIPYTEVSSSSKILLLILWIFSNKAIEEQLDINVRK